MSLFCSSPRCFQGKSPANSHLERQGFAPFSLDIKSAFGMYSHVCHDVLTTATDSPFSLGAKNREKGGPAQGTLLLALLLVVFRTHLLHAPAPSCVELLKAVPWILRTTDIDPLDRHRLRLGQRSKRLRGCFSTFCSLSSRIRCQLRRFSRTFRAFSCLTSRSCRSSLWAA